MYAAELRILREGDEIRSHLLAQSAERSDVEALVIDAIAYAKRPTTSLDARLQHDLLVFESARRRALASCLIALRDVLISHGTLDDPRAVRINVGESPHIVAVMDHEGVEHHFSTFGVPVVQTQEILQTVAALHDESGEHTFAIPL